MCISIGVHRHHSLRPICHAVYSVWLCGGGLARAPEVRFYRPCLHGAPGTSVQTDSSTRAPVFSAHWPTLIVTIMFSVLSFFHFFLLLMLAQAMISISNALHLKNVKHSNFVVFLLCPTLQNPSRFRFQFLEFSSPVLPGKLVVRFE